MAARDFDCAAPLEVHSHPCDSKSTGVGCAARGLTRRICTTLMSAHPQKASQAGWRGLLCATIGALNYAAPVDNAVMRVGKHAESA